MSTSTDAILAYGYDLGGEASDWKICDTGEYGELPELPWYNPDDEDDDFQSAAERHLLAQLADFTETDWRADGYHERIKEARARVGVTFDTYCHIDHPMRLLAAHTITMSRGYTEIINPTDLAAMPAAHDWDAKLAAAVTALGITPLQARPAWILCSYWG